MDTHKYTVTGFESPDSKDLAVLYIKRDNENEKIYFVKGEKEDPRNGHTSTAIVRAVVKLSQDDLTEEEFKEIMDTVFASWWTN